MAVLIRCTLCAVLLLLAQPGEAQPSESLQLFEQKIKAGLVYNFLKFTDWPADILSGNGGKINVCLYGGDSFDGYLYPLDGKTAQQYTISIENVDDIKEMAACNMIIVHSNKQASLSQLLQFLRGKPILTISDISDFASQGGMVEMAKEKERVNIYINEEQVNTAGVKIQSRILKLAKPVYTKG